MNPAPTIPVLPAWTNHDGKVLHRDHVVTTAVQVRIFRWTSAQPEPECAFTWSYRRHCFMPGPSYCKAWIK